jgi:hypothetical protein
MRLEFNDKRTKTKRHGELKILAIFPAYEVIDLLADFDDSFITFNLVIY